MQSVVFGLDRFLAADIDGDVQFVVVRCMVFQLGDFCFEQVLLTHVEHGGNGCVALARNIAKDEVKIKVFGVTIIVSR